MRTIDLFSVKNKLSKMELINAIKNSNGRTILAEIFITKSPLLGDISNLETARAFGADLLLLNDIDLSNIEIPGLNQVFKSISNLKKYVSCPIGLDLYVINTENTTWPTSSMEASSTNIRKAIKLGFDFINIVADPVKGVTNDVLINHIKKIPNEIKNKIVLISGRMNLAGLTGHSTEYFSNEFVTNLAEAGVDIFLLPTPGTAQGMDMTLATNLVNTASMNGMMTMSGIGSSQEGADEATIKTLAMNSRMIGVDIHHLGDAGYISGMATPENIMTYSVAIKGKRHTYRKMSRR